MDTEFALEHLLEALEREDCWEVYDYWEVLRDWTKDEGPPPEGWDRSHFAILMLAILAYLKESPAGKFHKL